MGEVLGAETDDVEDFIEDTSYLGVDDDVSDVVVKKKGDDEEKDDDAG